MNCFLFDRDFRHERVISGTSTSFLFQKTWEIVLPKINKLLQNYEFIHMISWSFMKMRMPATKEIDLPISCEYIYWEKLREHPIEATRNILGPIFTDIVHLLQVTTKRRQDHPTLRLSIKNGRLSRPRS